MLQYSSIQRTFSSREIRHLFLEYFKDHGHTFVASSSVLPVFDKSILFTNAGMNQFKPIFLGSMDTGTSFENVKRAVNYQKCIRVGGKHNDLGDVGNDLYHHTFFEMLGNWSFGDYFKSEACAMAWELLTKVYRLPKEKLYVTYFCGNEVLGLPSDEEVRQSWLDLGLPQTHILPFGMKDNFWEMGDIGPCGPSTEVHIDLAPDNCLIPAKQRVNAGRGDLVELWNLVFIQMNRDSSGNLTPLPRKHVDTGMGMERLAAVLQRTVSNYDTDLFLPILAALQKNAKVRPYSGLIGQEDSNGIDTAYRIVADHARMFTIAISDGVLPDHVGAGNKLRRIIRKASHVMLRHLKCDRGVLASLTDQVESILGDVYPGINVPLVKDVVNAEEEKYVLQMEKAEASIRNAKSKEISGGLAWELYVQHGLHKELIADIAKEKQLPVDWDGFSKHLKKFQEKSEEGKASPMPQADELMKYAEHLLDAGLKPTDTANTYQYTSSGGIYKFPDMTTIVEAIFNHGHEVDSVAANQKCLIVTTGTNFYYESGGQVSDKGYIIASNGRVTVTDVKYCNGFVFHRGFVSTGIVKKQDTAQMCIDKEQRHDCMLHHTATHILNAALRQVLGPTKQKSSLVDSQHLRFDFLSKTSLTNAQLQRVEDHCNSIIQKALPIQRQVYSRPDALCLPGLVTVPDEVYPSKVTVITVGTDEEAVSREPCCGTHALNSSDLGQIVVTSHRSVSACVKSLSAVAGHLVRQVNENGCAVEREMEELMDEILAYQNREEQEYMSLASTKKRVTHIRKLMSEKVISVLLQRTAEGKVEKLERQIDSIIRKYNKTVAEPKLSAELQRAIEAEKNSPFIVMHLKTPVDGKVVSRLVNKLCCHKPCFLIAHTGASELQVDCIVPKDVVTDMFRADRWASVTESFASIVTRTSNVYNTLETFCKVTASVEQMNVEDLKHVAAAYAKRHLPDTLDHVKWTVGE